MDGSSGDPGFLSHKKEGHRNSIDSAGDKIGSPKTNGHVSNHGSDNHVKTPSSGSSHKHKDGHHHSSSKHKHSSSHSSSSSSKDKHKSGSSSSKHSSSGSSSKDHHHKSSSSSSSSKHHSSSSSKDKHHSSSSSSGDKHKDRSKEHHHSSSSSKHKDSSSSSSKHKDGKHHSSSSSKHKDGEHRSKDKHSSSSSEKHKHSSGASALPNHHVKVEPGVKVKSEPRSPLKEERSNHASPTRVKSPPAKPIMSPTKVKREVESDDDIPLSSRKEAVKSVKRSHIDSDDDTPLSARAEKVKKVIKKEEKTPKNKKRKSEQFDEPVAKKKQKIKKEETTPSTGKKKKQEAEPEEKWRWWEEERTDDGTKWKTLEHKGPVFAPAYEPLPSNIKFYYDGEVMKLSQNAEEIAGFYAKMLEHDYTTKPIFNKNFFKDWRKYMTLAEREKIKDLSKCNFKEMHAFFTQQSEDRKNRSKEEKLALKKQNEALQAEYGFCIMDGHKEKIGNFKIEPPGLFRGRGEHPKQGMLKTRTQPEDVIINCSKGAKVPPAPEGHRWKEVRHDNTVTWLCCWTENVQNSTKYVMLNPTSRLKGEKDWMKYETARKLHKCVDKIRANYYEDFKSKEMRIRQRSVALYFIDKLALRAGNEKDEDTADTVGCCSLRVEHIKLYEKDGDQEYVVEFDFLGKDSIRYQNKVSVEKRVFKNLQLFTDNKSPGDDLFDRLNTAILNKHLHDLMEGLTAKVFRTYNASRTLQEQLDLLTNADDPAPAKLLAYNRANRAVAVLCNHQRAVPKNFSKQMENLQIKIKAKKEMVKEAKKQAKAAKADYKAAHTDKNKMVMEKKKKAVERLEDQLTKLEVQATDKDENKEIALGTSKLNYLDPRISIAWCKKWEIPVEKVYNKTQREKFAWAIDMADETFHF